jgi:hypothetical protein
MHRMEGSPAALKELTDLEELAESWRYRAQQLLQSLG